MLTFCIQHFRKKKQNILLCSIFTSLLLILVKTTYNVKDIGEDLRHTNIRQPSLINDEGRDPLYPNQQKYKITAQVYQRIHDYDILQKLFVKDNIIFQIKAVKQSSSQNIVIARGKLYQIKQRQSLARMGSSLILTRQEVVT